MRVKEGGRGGYSVYREDLDGRIYFVEYMALAQLKSVPAYLSIISIFALSVCQS